MLFLLLLPVVSARAEASLPEGIGALEALSGENGGPELRPMLLRMLAGEAPFPPETLLQWLAALLSGAKRGFLRRTLRLLLPGLAGGLLGSLLGKRGHAAEALRLVCRVAGAGMMAAVFEETMVRASALIERSAALANGMAPVLASAAAVSGLPETAASIPPMAALCSALLTGAMPGYGLRLCRVLAVMAGVGNLTEALRLDRLFSLGRRLILWGLGLLLAGYMGLLSAQGLLASTRDGAASRAAHIAVESLVPLIGRQVSEALGSLLLSGAALRGAVGIGAMLLVAGACAAPLAGMASAAVSLRLAGGLAEAAGEVAYGRMADQFAGAVELLLAMGLGSLLLTLFLAGGITAMGGFG